MFAAWQCRELGYRPMEVGLSPMDEARLYMLETARDTELMNAMPEGTRPVAVVADRSRRA